MIPLHLADQAVAACNKEIAELRAQVAELKRQPDALTAYLYAAELAKADIKKLKAANERLRAAGDAVCESPYALETDPAVIEWRAACEAANKL